MVFHSNEDMVQVYQLFFEKSPKKSQQKQQESIEKQRKNENRQQELLDLIVWNCPLLNQGNFAINITKVCQKSLIVRKYCQARIEDNQYKKVHYMNLGNNFGFDLNEEKELIDIKTLLYYQREEEKKNPSNISLKSNGSSENQNLDILNQQIYSLQLSSEQKENKIDQQQKEIQKLKREQSELQIKYEQQIKDLMDSIKQKDQKIQKLVNQSANNTDKNSNQNLKDLEDKIMSRIVKELKAQSEQKEKQEFEEKLRQNYNQNQTRQPFYPQQQQMPNFSLPTRQPGQGLYQNNMQNNFIFDNNFKNI
ncbi:hypothetical protein PPERSA_01461 [Pseudocohnilembus persalinus]|uniref:Uncharacterized protein n=1 Tax=Pseudocohnilembus persalinus TaxID=266149 RepID=A0A0V0QHB2_PSEPJ|nr:hypothetical protein PPERSA_01461 [Pseudocohnilembus persalinus]|eukprot:KRX01558.1 hypothetical protein PPERSA_01461 [Pseudocohnilembus persalinus]